MMPIIAPIATARPMLPELPDDPDAEPPPAVGPASAGAVAAVPGAGVPVDVAEPAVVDAGAWAEVGDAGVRVGEGDAGVAVGSAEKPVTDAGEGPAGGASAGEPGAGAGEPGAGAGESGAGAGEPGAGDVPFPAAAGSVEAGPSEAVTFETGLSPEAATLEAGATSGGSVIPGEGSGVASPR